MRMTGGVSPSTDTAPARAGIRGWLGVFVAMEMLLLLALLATAPSQLRGLHDGLTVMAGWMPPPLIRTGMWEYALFGLAAFVWITAGTAHGLDLVLRRRRSAPWFWRRFLTLMVTLLVVDFAWDQLLDWYFLPASVAAEGRIAELLERACAIAILGAWLLYWRHSRRVHETFGR